jgi:hypothetical protein
VAKIVSAADVVSSIVGEMPLDNAREPTVVKRNDGSRLLDGALDPAVRRLVAAAAASSALETASVTCRKAHPAPSRQGVRADEGFDCGPQVRVEPRRFVRNERVFRHRHIAVGESRIVPVSG